jgi:hypothetical protein
MEAMFGGVPVNPAAAEAEQQAAVEAADKAAKDAEYQADAQARYRQRQEEDFDSNGTIARLITTHKPPITAPTPGADYGKNTPTDLANAFNGQHAYALNQWQAGKGVVGPNGHEGEALFAGYNDPKEFSGGYGDSQDFAYQHDLQAWDASLQAKTPEEQQAFDKANRDSAVAGMLVLKTSGSVKKALAKTKQVFGESGFTVRENYSPQ